MNIIFSRPRRAGAREFRLANDIALMHATYLNCLITLTLFSVSVSGLNDSRSYLELRDVKQRNGRREEKIQCKNVTFDSFDLLLFVSKSSLRILSL